MANRKETFLSYSSCIVSEVKTRIIVVNGVESLIDSEKDTFHQVACKSVRIVFSHSSILSRKESSEKRFCIKTQAVAGVGGESKRVPCER